MRAVIRGVHEFFVRSGTMGCILSSPDCLGAIRVAIGMRSFAKPSVVVRGQTTKYIIFAADPVR